MSRGNSPTASERLTDILSREQQSAASTNKATHGSKPQSYKDNDDAEYDGLKSLTRTSSNRAQQPRKNCCTWKVATVFLLFVAALLVVIWLMLPAEDIVAKYIPEFSEPENPYLGEYKGILYYYNVIIFYLSKILSHTSKFYIVHLTNTLSYFFSCWV